MDHFSARNKLANVDNLEKFFYGPRDSPLGRLLSKYQHQNSSQRMNIIYEVVQIFGDMTSFGIFLLFCTRL